MEKISFSIPASWKTSLIGIVSLVFAAYQALNEPTFMAAVRDPAFQTKVILGVLALFAKDYNTTGGTSPATPEAQMRVAADSGKR